MLSHLPKLCFLPQTPLKISGLILKHVVAVYYSPLPLLSVARRRTFHHPSSFGFSGDRQISPSEGKLGANKARKINLNRHGRSGHYT